MTRYPVAFCSLAFFASLAFGSPNIRSDVLYLGDGPKSQEMAEEIRTVYGFVQKLDFASTKKFPQKKQPIAISQPVPTFPASPERVAFQGRVIAVFIIDEKGGVSEATVLDCTSAYISERVRQAVLTWKFKPAIRGKTPVRTLMRQPLTIDTNKEAEPGATDNPDDAQGLREDH